MRPLVLEMHPVCYYADFHGFTHFARLARRTRSGLDGSSAGLAVRHS